MRFLTGTQRTPPVSCLWVVKAVKDGPTWSAFLVLVWQWDKGWPEMVRSGRSPVIMCNLLLLLFSNRFPFADYLTERGLTGLGKNTHAVGVPVCQGVVWLRNMYCLRLAHTQKGKSWRMQLPAAREYCCSIHALTHEIKVGEGFFCARQRHEDHSEVNAVQVPQLMFYVFYCRKNTHTHRENGIFPSVSYWSSI